MTHRCLAWTPLVLLLAACTPAAPPSAEAAQARQAALECRQEADRIMVRRDRSDLTRIEEQESRLGAGAYAGPVTEIDRLALTWSRNRMADACTRGRNENLELAPGQAAPTAGRPASGIGLPATARPAAGTALPPPRGS